MASSFNSRPNDFFEPPAINRAKVLLEKVMKDLQEGIERLEEEISKIAHTRAQLRGRIEGGSQTRKGMYENLHKYTAQQVEEIVNEYVLLKAELASYDERGKLISFALTECRKQQENLWALQRDLQEMAQPRVVPRTASQRLRTPSNASRQVFQMVEEERMRIARDMHDGPAQSMANLVLQAEIMEKIWHKDPPSVLPELVKFKKEVRNVLDETRRLIFDLRPMTLDDLGLIPTLRKFIEEFGENNNISAHLHVIGEVRRMPGNFEETLFRIIQEGLTNIKKHAEASLAEVTLVMKPGRVAVGIKDDGKGFDVERMESQLGRKHLGLISMRERAELEKGDFEITSAPDQGTEIKVSFNY